MDLYERAEGKMSGAWMKEAVFRRALPTAVFNCPLVILIVISALRKQASRPPYAYEVGDVLLHEFGHNLQHLLRNALFSRFPE